MGKKASHDETNIKSENNSTLQYKENKLKGQYKETIKEDVKVQDNYRGLQTLKFFKVGLDN